MYVIVSFTSCMIYKGQEVVATATIKIYISLHTAFSFTINIQRILRKMCHQESFLPPFLIPRVSKTAIQSHNPTDEITLWHQVMMDVGSKMSVVLNCNQLN